MMSLNTTDQAEYQINLAGMTNSDLLDAFARVSIVNQSNPYRSEILGAIRTELLARMSS
jgi:hypothetical protein